MSIKESLKEKLEQTKEKLEEYKEEAKEKRELRKSAKEEAEEEEKKYYKEELSKYYKERARTRAKRQAEPTHLKLKRGLKTAEKIGGKLQAVDVAGQQMMGVPPAPTRRAARARPMPPQIAEPYDVLSVPFGYGAEPRQAPTRRKKKKTTKKKTTRRAQPRREQRPMSMESLLFGY